MDPVAGPIKPTHEVTAQTPPEIRAALTTSAMFFPDLARPEYTERRDLNRLYLDLLELDYTKLQTLIEKHNDAEPPAKLKLRRMLAATVNLVPSVLNLIRLYIFSEDPSIDVKGDAALETFLEDCDGNGTTFIQYVRDRVLPLSMLFGHVDALVQNPLVTDAPLSQADATDAGIRPRLHMVTPLQRINWSCQPNGAYNWVCFRDRGSEDRHPLRRNAKPPEAFVTLSAANADFARNPAADTGCWIRSWQPLRTTGTGTPPLPEAPLAPGQVQGNLWRHEADWTPTSRVPIATLYHQRSVDPERPHDGVSKVATIAVLTKQIIQILSWTTEDILANLALLALPSPGGRKPEGADSTQLDAHTILWYSDKAAHPPTMVQGTKDHIEIKLKLVEFYITEILRLAHLIGANGKAEKVTSGVQGMVMRTELHRELADTAENLDRFTLSVLALVKSWASGADWDVEKLQKDVEPTVVWFKGPYTMDAAKDVIENAAAIIEMYRQVSPTLCEQAFRMVARAYLPADDQSLDPVLKEIADNTGRLLEDARELEELASAAAAAAGKQAGSVQIREQDAGGEGAGGGGASSPAPAKPAATGPTS